jgi:formylmethanofuran dehydrogenase subunit E
MGIIQKKCSICGKVIAEPKVIGLNGDLICSKAKM